MLTSSKYLVNHDMEEHNPIEYRIILFIQYIPAHRLIHYPESYLFGYTHLMCKLD